MEEKNIEIWEIFKNKYNLQQNFVKIIFCKNKINEI